MGYYNLIFSTVYFIFLTNFCLLDLLSSNRSSLKSSTMIVDLSTYPYNSVNFCFCIPMLPWDNSYFGIFCWLFLYYYVISHFTPISALCPTFSFYLYLYCCTSVTECTHLSAWKDCLLQKPMTFCLRDYFSVHGRKFYFIYWLQSRRNRGGREKK